MWLFALFILVPIIEIGLFIQVGGLIGLWPTLGLVVLSAFLGAALIRRQGLRAVDSLRREVDAGGDPSRKLVEGALVVLSGLLLLVPGFLTDTAGLLLLLPPVRAAAVGRAAAGMRQGSFVFATGTARAQRRPEPGVIDADYEVLDDVPPSERGASGWTRPGN